MSLFPTGKIVKKHLNIVLSQKKNITELNLASSYTKEK